MAATQSVLNAVLKIGVGEVVWSTYYGEEAAREERSHWCVAPLHKSNYVLVTNKQDLAGLNNKGGLVR